MVLYGLVAFLDSNFNIVEANLDLVKKLPSPIKLEFVVFSAIKLNCSTLAAS
jgi:hypothetical protein